MKKIKLLLLGIVSILGISLSSAQNYNPNFESSMFSSSVIWGGSFFTIETGIVEYDYSDSCVWLGNPLGPGQEYYDLITYSFDGINFYSGNIYLSLLCGKFYLNNQNSSSTSVYYTRYDGFFNIQNGLFSASSDRSYTIPLGQSFVDFSNSSTCFIYGSSSYKYKVYSDSSYSNLLGSLDSVNNLLCGPIYINNTATRAVPGGVYIFTGRNYFVESNTGGDTPQDFETPVQGGIRDYNTMLIEKAILCYMSDGAYGGSYGDCDGLNYSGFINQYDPSYSTWSGSSIEDYYGQLSFTNAQPVLSNYCVNTDLIQYPFCSQLDLYSGAYLLYFFENGKLDYYVLGDGFGVDLGNLGSGQLGELTCQGAWCNNIIQGLPEYIIPTNSGNNNDFGLSGDIISEDFYNDFIEKGFWFSCPYSYSGSYFVLGKDLIDRLGGRDLMIPINCFVSAFSQGRKMLFFGDPEYGKYGEGSLINGNTPGHQRLFLFFDLVLSLGIIVVLSKLFKLLTTKK